MRALYVTSSDFTEASEHAAWALCTVHTLTKSNTKESCLESFPSDLRHVYYESQCLLASHRAFCSYKNMVFNYREKRLIFSYQHISTQIKSLFLNCIGLGCLIFKIVIWKLRRELSCKNWLEDLGSAPRIHMKNQAWCVCYDPVPGKQGQADSCRSLSSQLNLLGHFPARKRPCPKTNKQINKQQTRSRPKWQNDRSNWHWRLGGASPGTVVPVQARKWCGFFHSP